MPDIRACCALTSKSPKFRSARQVDGQRDGRDARGRRGDWRRRIAAVANGDHNDPGDPPPPRGTDNRDQLPGHDQPGGGRDPAGDRGGAGGRGTGSGSRGEPLPCWPNIGDELSTSDSDVRRFQSDISEAHDMLKVLVICDRWPSDLR
jgi:hypothetical protein